MDMYGLVPQYDGKTSPENFIDCGDFVYQALGLAQVPIFLNLIKVRLSGRAHGACLRENFASWESCKRVLRHTCHTKCSSAELRAKLQAMTQGNESVREWGDKVEKCLHDLNNTIRAEFQNPSREVYQALVRVHENAALSVFEDGLRLEELRVTVRAAARPTLNEAISLAAKQEVRVGQSRPIVPQNSYRTITKEAESGAARPEPTCFKCNNKGHYANECRRIGTIFWRPYNGLGKLFCTGRSIGPGVPYVNKPPTSQATNKLVLSFLPFERTILLTIPLDISTHKACTFLVDTCADVSIILKSALKNKLAYYPDAKIELSGIVQVFGKLVIS